MSAGRPLYARMLRLKHTSPSWLLSLFLFEGSVVVGLLAWFAELVDWWGVLLVPLCVAAAVKFNDVLVGVLVAAGFTGARGAAAGEASIGRAPVAEHLRAGPSPTARARVPRPVPPSWAWPTMAEQTEQPARGVAKVDGPDSPVGGGRNGRSGEPADAPTFRADPSQTDPRLGNQRRFEP